MQPTQEAAALKRRAVLWSKTAGVLHRVMPTPSRASDDFFETSLTQGLVVYELCGGMCAGLEMLLRNGLHIAEYYYNDVAPSARRIAAYRVQVLQTRYSHLLHVNAFNEMMSLPDDVYKIDISMLLARNGTAERVLLMSGWPCQDLSQANSAGQGLDGPRSRAILPIVNLLIELNKLRHSPTAYLLENINAQHAFGENEARGKTEYAKLVQMLGVPVTFDAAAVGSRSHRVRNWWSNFMDSSAVNAILSSVKRDKGIYVNQILLNGFVASRANQSQQPFYACNGLEVEREALPTLTAFPQSNSYRGVASGVLKRLADKAEREPCAEERERLQGYDAMATAAEGVTTTERNIAIGNAWNIDAAAALLSVCIVLSELPRQSNNPVAAVHSEVPNWSYEYGVPLSYDTVESNPDGVELLRRQYESHFPFGHFSNGFSKKELLKVGFVAGKGLGSDLQGMVHPLGADESIARPRAGLGSSATTKPRETHEVVFVSGGNIKSSTSAIANSSLSYFPSQNSLKKVAQERDKRVEDAKSRQLVRNVNPIGIARFQPTRPLTLHGGGGLSHGTADLVGDDDGAEDLMVSSRGVSMKPYNDFARDCAMAAVAELSDLEGNNADPHKDAVFLEFLKTGGPTAGEAPDRVRAMQKRAKSYRWGAVSYASDRPDGSSQVSAAQEKEALLRVLADGSTRLVPSVQDRVQVVKEIHHASGHMGSRRTEALVRKTCWWPCLSTDVRKLLRQCSACDRVRASRGGTQMPLLRPLPLTTVGYRFSCDWAGGFPKSNLNNTHLFIIVEHATRWVEVWPTAIKNAATSAFLFNMLVIARFGAPAEVLTDGGSEFNKEFHELMRECMISHRFITPGNPQANGLAERIVQVFKKAIAKIGAGGLNELEWDMALGGILHAYRSTAQTSLKFSPYELIFGIKPVFTANTAERMQTPLFDQNWVASHEKEIVKELIERGALMIENRALALSNLQVAQTRDTLRYAKVRSGAYLPTLRRFGAGDLVYLSRENSELTQAKVHDAILRVVGFKQDSGDAVLEGSDGTRINSHMSRLRPCHLINVDLTVDTRRLVPNKKQPCMVCLSPEDAATMLLCDKCNNGYHLTCLTPPLLSVPKGDWLCPACILKGEVVAVRAKGEDAWYTPVSVGHKRHDLVYRALHGCRVRKLFDVQGEKREFEGTVRYDGYGPKNPLVVEWEDGEESILTEAQVRKFKIKETATAAAIVPYSGLSPAYRFTGLGAVLSQLSLDWSTVQSVVALRRAFLPQLHLHRSREYESGVTFFAKSTEVQNKLAQQLVSFLSANGSPKASSEKVAAQERCHEQAVRFLFGSVDVSREFTDVFMPFSTAALSSAVKHGGSVVYGFPWASRTQSLQPSMYHEVARQLASYVIVTVPPVEVLDWLIPILLAFSKTAAYILVPLSYVVDDSVFDRREFLSALVTEERLAFLHVPSSGLSRTCYVETNVWLAIYSEPAFKLAAMTANQDRMSAVGAHLRLTDEPPYVNCGFAESVTDVYTQ